MTKFLYAIRRDLSWDKGSSIDEGDLFQVSFLYAIRRDLSWDAAAVVLALLTGIFLYAIRRDLSWDDSEFWLILGKAAVFLYAIRRDLSWDALSFLRRPDVWFVVSIRHKA